MSGYAIPPPVLPFERGGRVKPIIPKIVMPMPAIEKLFGDMEKRIKEAIGALILKPWEERLNDGIVMMAGDLGGFASKSALDLIFGKTAYTGPTTNVCFGLWTAAIDGTMNGATASEAAYTSYARLALTDNTTIFAAGTGTDLITKTFPSDALKSWPASTGGTAPTCTYMGILDGNAGSSADKCLAWCTITSTTINTGDTPQLAQNAVTLTQT
jgi:hypothetical protein